MNIALNIMQRLCGLALIAFIVAELFGWRPPTIEEGAGKPLMDAIKDSGYIFVVIRVVYVASGLAMLVDRFAALAAVVLFPISVNILLFHAVLHQESLAKALVFITLNCIVLFHNRAAYRAMFRPQIKNAPSTSKA